MKSLWTLVVVALLCFPGVAGAEAGEIRREPVQGRAAVGAGPSDSSREQAAESFGNLPLAFVENRGQTDKQVLYHAQGSDYGFFITPDEVMLSFTKESQVPTAGAASPTGVRSRSIGLALRFLRANPQVQLEGRGLTSAQINYLRGDDPARWRTGLPGYSGVVYRELWPGVDMVLRGDDGKLKYEFRVQPGARLADIRLAYAGAKRLALDPSGGLLVKTPWAHCVTPHPCRTRRSTACACRSRAATC